MDQDMVASAAAPLLALKSGLKLTISLNFHQLDAVANCMNWVLWGYGLSNVKEWILDCEGCLNSWEHLIVVLSYQNTWFIGALDDDLKSHQITLKHLPLYKKLANHQFIALHQVDA